MTPDLSSYRVLIVPGLHNSGPEHWQTRWQHLYPAFERVEQDDWEHPDLPIWSQRLQQQLQQSRRPTIIIAHSFGCLTTMHAAGRFSHVAAALLVAPADPQKFGVAAELSNARLPCPSVVIGSADDPWMASHRASHWADTWRSGFINVGALGHINAESGLGDWPDGLRQLTSLLEVASLATQSRNAVFS
jgi:predicted alpha/beta hydrolase family esterase